MADKPGQCDEDSSKANKDKAYAADKNTVYGRATVHVIESSATDIKFKVPGDPDEREYKVKWGDKSVMWAACPSTLPSNATADDAGTPPAAGEVGELLLSEAFLEDPIDKKNFSYSEPKWPRRQGIDPVYAPISLALTSLVASTVHYGPDGAPRYGKIELFDRNKAAPGQAVTNDGAWLEMRISENGRADVNAIPSIDYRLLEGAVAAIEKNQDLQEIAAAWQIVARAAGNPDVLKEKDRALLERVRGRLTP
jgi:hypothetical protein